ncbi:hypothetical protein AAIH70_27235 [Neorhizobium sp. BT27B]|uniref:hypothetical protein n=1 Tax=Neorhizobium sp. BT27B TaxID=3142625 RepID=UPI003D2B79F9
MVRPEFEFEFDPEIGSLKATSELGDQLFPGQLATLADLADWESQRDGNRFFGPAECDEPLDTAPLVDRIRPRIQDKTDPYLPWL